MKLSILVAMTTLTTGTLFGCSNDSNGTPNTTKQIKTVEAKVREDIHLTSDGEKINNQVRTFSFNLFREVAKAEKETNYCLSPLGVTFDMGMVMNGADGETLKQMQNALGFSGFALKNINEYIKTMRTSLPELDNLSVFTEANSIWAKKGLTFRNEYIAINKTYYDAEIKENLSFDNNTVKEINEWCNKKTKGLIPDFLNDIPDDLVSLILNALYFKGTWESPFDTNATNDKPFYLADGSHQTVHMMHQDIETDAMSDGDVTIVELPYGNSAFSMYVFMPTNTNNSIDALLTTINADTWTKWINAMDYSEVVLSLPRFQMKDNRELTDILRILGIKDAFGATANFSKMSPSFLNISSVKQKTAIEVAEEGTVAAAVTGTEMVGSAGPAAEPKTIKANFNHPFGFVISEKSTGSILFAGKVGNPQ